MAWVTTVLSQEQLLSGITVLLRRGQNWCPRSGTTGREPFADALICRWGLHWGEVA